MLTFREIVNSVSRLMGDQSLPGIAIAKEQINRVQREIATRAVWPHLVDEKQFKLVTSNTTGTADVTNNSFTVTGTSTSWDQSFVGRMFRIAATNIFYRVAAVASTTSLRLDKPYQGTTATAASIEFIKDMYALERDTMGVIKMRMPEASRLIYPETTSNLFELTQDIEGSGIPEFYFDGGRTDLPYYNTGTVTVTVDSSTVTGASTAFDSTMVGRQFKIRGETKTYLIRTRDSDTQITLDTPYRGQTASGMAYEIDPPGIPLVRLYPHPSSAYHVYYNRKRKPRILTEDDDLPDFPDDFSDILVAGGYYYVLFLRGAGADLIGLAKQDYESQLKEKMSRNAITDPNYLRQSQKWGTGYRSRASTFEDLTRGRTATE